MFDSAKTIDTGFGAFGFGTTAASAEGMAGTLGGSSVTSSTLAITSDGSIAAVGEAGFSEAAVYFNPYALAAAVAIQLIMDAMSCTQDELDLANAKSKNFCHYVGSYCSKEIKVLGKVVGCLETSQTYCCYNGLLGKAIEEGAHQQLGISWGSPKSPACGGLSVAQLQALDFTTPAMAAFMAPFQEEIMAGFNSSVSPSLANGTVSTAAQTSATSKSAALCLQSQKQNPSIVCP
jgi:conjugal transfer mating pair stabilization protein TraN